MCYTDVDVQQILGREVRAHPFYHSFRLAVLYSLCFCGGAAFTGFRAVSLEEVRRVLTTMLSKSSPLDVVPASLMKSCVDVLFPVIARLVNLSFKEGHFPSRHKTAQVLPLLKKQRADPLLPENYRPISNLTTISKVLERLSLAQLRPHLLGCANFCKLQSAYRAGHSTGTATAS